MGIVEAYLDFLHTALLQNKLDNLLVLGGSELGLECLVARLVVDALYTLSEQLLAPNVVGSCSSRAKSTSIIASRC